MISNDTIYKIQSIGSGANNFNREEWLGIIQEILVSFKRKIEQDFYSESESDIYLELGDPRNPVFTVWLWTGDFEGDCWSAVMSGGIVASDVKNDLNEEFVVSLTMFYFDKETRQRIRKETGESIVEFILKKNSDQQMDWICLGWVKDEWGEWDDVQWD